MVSLVLSKNQWKVKLGWQALHAYKFLFIRMTPLSRDFLMIVKHSSIHRLQLGFIIIVSPIGLSRFTTFNGIHIRSSVCGLVDSKFY